MSAIWKSEEFSEGGFKALKSFSGRLVNVEEDVEGKFAIQKRFDWQDCEIIETTEPLTLKDGNFSDWMKQSGSKSSVDAKVVAKLEKFCAENKIKGSLPTCLYEKNIVWEQFIVEFDGEGADGTAMQPGYAYAPVSLVGKDEKKAPTRGRKIKEESDNEKQEPVEPESDDASESDSAEESTPVEIDIPELVHESVVKTLGDDGATRDMIARELKKTAKLRKALGEVDGGIDTVLEAMEQGDIIGSDGDFYFPVPQDDEAGF
ncbi:hypothetical protein LCGC14_1726090 [marine sediment metagenome]|uniref:Uncharacterized protein n=1 Tax=marine sediment metagenome TaxID=412755 RepID=A0A0F9JRJ2_9ZZZZ